MTLSLNKGLGVLRDTLTTLPSSPGVYRMLDENGGVLYVGKARNLRARVRSYTQVERLPNRLRRMVSLTRAVMIVTTHTEVEALLLESNLIKTLEPRYNVLLRDDKSFPYIHIRTDHPFAQIALYRGAMKKDGHYFGPYFSADLVRQTLKDLQRVFLLRPCSDTYFAARTRPCLQYHIKRCSAPCVGHITVDEYGQLVTQAVDFLKGRSNEVQKKLSRDMLAASEALNFERAAQLRNRIQALTQSQAKQDINVPRLTDTDVIAVAQEGGLTALEVFFFRQGRLLGNGAFFPRHDDDADAATVLQAFLGQFYADKDIPTQILLNHAIPERALFEKAFTEKQQRRVRIRVPQKGDLKNVVAMAAKNARQELQRKQAHTLHQAERLLHLQRAFDLGAPPQRIEIYDNSHISGQHALGVMVVATPEGFDKKSYRTFNIAASDLKGGDDYAMLREVMTRRFRKDTSSSGSWPDLVLIDGGLGQLNAARAALAGIGITDLPLVAMAKGEHRNAGMEKFFLPDRSTPLHFAKNDPVLFYLQQLRDEAHRFAIGGHRQRRQKSMTGSALDDIPGIGARRKKALLLHFGSVAAIKKAGVADLMAIEGISRSTAQTIYNYFHPS